MNQINYLMENSEEILRLNLKTNKEPIVKQAKWAGIAPGMRVLDVGCGSGKTSYFLNELVQPHGEVIGLDGSLERIQYARKHYNYPQTQFVCKDIFQPIKEVGTFDFIWIRFFLEFYRSKSFEIIKKLTDILKPGGVMCLVDLDNNCLNHFGLSSRLQKTIYDIMITLEKDYDFDPFMGRKLYSFLYDLGYADINLRLDAHHLIYGELKESDAFNWGKKIEAAGKISGYDFKEYDGDYKEFVKEFITFFKDPRRFTYTPAICCRGSKPIF